MRESDEGETRFEINSKLFEFDIATFIFDTVQRTRFSFGYVFTMYKFTHCQIFHYRLRS